MVDANKINLRKKYLSIRNRVTSRKSKDKEISNRLKKLINTNGLKTAVYHSVNNEVNLVNFIKFMRLNKQRVLLPVIEKINSHLIFKEWKVGEKLILGKFRIKIPQNNVLLSPRIIVVPMLAFDKSKNRLGYGGGYYDRTISFLEKRNKIMKFGVAFDEQESDYVPTSRLDKKMDVIITQSRIII